MGEIYTAVKNIIIFMLLLTVIMNLVGKSNFKQYIRIFAGLILILIVSKPLFSLFHVEDKVFHYFNWNLYKINASDITGELYNAQDEYQGKVISEYKKMIAEQINTQISAHNLEISKLSLSIETDTEKSNCGQILAINLIAKNKEQKESDTNTNVNNIDQVIIDKININSQKSNLEENEDSDECDTVLELTIKQELVSLYGVNMENIKVNIV